MIEKGQDWGHDGSLPDDAPVAENDAAAAQLIGGTHRIIGLSGGDLARTLGLKAPYDRTGPKRLVAVDALQIVLDDGSRHLCMANATIGSLLFDRHAAAVMNAAFIGRRNVAPRAHPGDGKADLVVSELAFGDRVKAWQRMPTGTHVPHPNIKMTRQNAGRVQLPRPRSVRIDGRRRGRSQTLTFTVLPEALVVAVA